MHDTDDDGDSTRRADNVLWGRIGGLRRHALHDPRESTGPARRAFRQRFEQRVDPDGLLPEAERVERASRLLRAHMLELAQRSAAKRRRRRPAHAASLKHGAGENVVEGDQGFTSTPGEPPEKPA